MIWDVEVEKKTKADPLDRGVWKILVWVTKIEDYIFFFKEISIHVVIIF